MNNYPIIVIAYDDNIRKSLGNSLAPFGVASVPCATFCDAENRMLSGLYQGIVVDLTSMIKAKGEEKVVACSLTGFYPTLRVKALGAMVVPMAMSGDARQDKSLGDFLNKTASGFTPRKLRSHRRREMHVPVVIHARAGEQDGIRSCTQNLSWGGMFLIEMNPERFSVDQVLTVSIPDFELKLEVDVVWINPWRQRKAPGLGVKFKNIDDQLEQALAGLLRSDRNHDRDRLVA